MRRLPFPEAIFTGKRAARRLAMRGRRRYPGGTRRARTSRENSETKNVDQGVHDDRISRYFRARRGLSLGPIGARAHRHDVDLQPAIHLGALYRLAPEGIRRRAVDAAMGVLAAGDHADLPVAAAR